VQELGQVLAILSRYSGDEGLWHVVSFRECDVDKDARADPKKVPPPSLRT
jgi:hypothetical protein